MIAIKPNIRLPPKAIVLKIISPLVKSGVIDGKVLVIIARQRLTTANIEHQNASVLFCFRYMTVSRKDFSF